MAELSDVRKGRKSGAQPVMGTIQTRVFSHGKQLLCRYTDEWPYHPLEKWGVKENGHR